jgi:hypothetical protein
MARPAGSRRVKMRFVEFRREGSGQPAHGNVACDALILQSALQISIKRLIASATGAPWKSTVA